MQIKVPTTFIPFKDGYCDIYDGSTLKYGKIAFEEQKLGITRFFSARTAQTEINRVISVPLIVGVSQYDTVVIADKKYMVELIQPTDETNPPSITLTLRLLEVLA